MLLTVVLFYELCNSIIPSIYFLILCFNFQSLLQLANLYAISSSSHPRKLATLGDKIGLCYVFKNRLSSSDEVLFPNQALLKCTKCARNGCVMIPMSEHAAIVVGDCLQSPRKLQPTRFSSRC